MVFYLVFLHPEDSDSIHPSQKIRFTGTMDGEVSSHSSPSAENGSAAAASPDYPDVSSPLESVGAKSPDAGEDYDGAVSSRGGSVIGSASRGSPPMSPVYKEDE